MTKKKSIDGVYPTAESDQLNNIANAIRRLAEAVLPYAAAPSEDASGGFVNSLTEAVTGMTTGLVRIADSINRVADSISELADAVDVEK